MPKIHGLSLNAHVNVKPIISIPEGQTLFILAEETPSLLSPTHSRNKPNSLHKDTGEICLLLIMAVSSGN